MSVFPSPKDIIAALRQSGYLMEQEVATQLENLNFHVWTNWAFEDSDEGRSREIDVRAIKRVAYNEDKKLAAFLEIIVECKNSANPFVFIGRPKNQTDGQYAPQELVFPIAKYRSQKKIEESHAQIRERDAFFHLGFEQVHYEFSAGMKAVQFCRIDRKGKNWQANHGGLYDSIFYPMAKALTVRKSEIPVGAPPDEWRYFWFFVPMVVTSGDIFYVDSTEADPVPQEKDYVTFKREIRSEKLKGTFALDFIRQDRLEQFVSDCLHPLVVRMVDLTTNKADSVLKQDIPWEE